MEPPLQTLLGEHLPHATANREDNARLDVKARGFWGTPGRAATVAYKQLATLIAAKREQPCSDVMGWLKMPPFLLPATFRCDVP